LVRAHRAADKVALRFDAIIRAEIPKIEKIVGDAGIRLD
jgi:hypothetical protein